MDVLTDSLDSMYDDQFVETCARWVAPYLGDLVGYRPLHGVAPEVASRRAEVANTVRYRRRKGTATMLEQLASDVTGWPARAVEFFERLATSQYLNHLRPHALATADLRGTETLGWVGTQAGAFDTVARTADVRRIAAPAPHAPGRHNIPNVGIVLWRTEAVRLTRSPLVPHGPGDGRRFRLDPLGADAPLFALPRTEPDITHLAEPFDVPLPLARRWLATHLGRYYGRGLSLLLETTLGGSDPVPVSRADVRICDLSDAPGGGGGWAHEPPAGAVAVDPVLGRVWFGTALAAGQTASATFHYGAAVRVGAGGWSRGDPATPVPWRAVGDGVALLPALTALAPTGGTLTITDSERYAAPATITLDPTPAGTPDPTLWVRAADHARPVLTTTSTVHLALGPRGRVVLDGLVVAGGPLVLDESGDTQPRTVELRDCTLVPGYARTAAGQPVRPDGASLIVLDPFATVLLERCVVGSIVAVDGATVTLTDCVLDASDPSAVAFCGRAEPSGGGLRTVASPADAAVGDGMTPGGHLEVCETTVVGGVHASVLDASNSLLHAELVTGDPRSAAVWARRRQVGCVRFSWLPAGSRIGRTYRCVSTSPVPSFTSLRFGDPGYAQLRPSTDDAVRRGSEAESEMGVTHDLFTPQREANLRLRLEEYLRFGLEAGFAYAT
jgi:hypothetical protein